MFYDSKNTVDVQRARARFEILIKSGKTFELTEKKLHRSGQQNRYLHLILTWFGIETGNTLEYVKDNYFKRLCNPELFIETKQDGYLGAVQVLKSSSSLDSAQMTAAIERFRNWSAGEGVYLPGPNEDEFLKHIAIEAERYKNYI